MTSFEPSPNFVVFPLFFNFKATWRASPYFVIIKNLVWNQSEGLILMELACVFVYNEIPVDPSYTENVFFCRIKGRGTKEGFVCTFYGYKVEVRRYGFCAENPII